MKKLFSLFAAVLFAGSMMATTYGAEMVDEVSAGELYVFAQTVNGTTYVMTNSVASGKAAISSDFLATALAGNETYVWTLETAEGGFYIKSANNNMYLNNTNKGNLTLDATKTTVWSFEFSGDFALITNVANSRFLGINDGVEGYKAYAADNLSTYPHNIVVWELDENSTGSIDDSGEGGGGGGESGDHDYTYDETSSNFNVEFASYTLDDSDFDTYKSLYIEAEDDDLNVVSIDFYPTGTEPVLTPGTYNFRLDDETYPAGSITAGEYWENNIYPSYAAVLDDEGYITQVWYMVSGTMTVAEDGTITINAVNSKGKTINVILHVGAQSIENVELTDQAHKVLVDGALYIVRDRKIYNVQGARVK